MSQRKPIIGLAGGIGSGKSLVARQLASLGAAVVDADTIARDSLDQPDVKAQLVEWWGPEVLDETGCVNRRHVADRVFDDPDQRRRLEGLIHPIVAARRERIMAESRQDPAVKAVVIDAPLLFEAELDQLCDQVIFIEADRPTRLMRVSADRRWDERELARREKSQIPLDFKRRQAHHIVINDSDESNCFSQVRGVFSRILSQLRNP